MTKPFDVITFRCTSETLGMPEPPIEEGAIIILYQEGTAEVGRYEPPMPDDPFPRFEHPTNTEAGKSQALRLVAEAQPLLDSYKQSYVLVCPQALARQAEWREKGS